MVTNLLVTFSVPNIDRMQTWTLILLLVPFKTVAIDIPVPPNCILTGGEWSGQRITTFTNIQTFDNCATLCNSHGACKKAMWGPNGKKCFLFRNGATWGPSPWPRLSLRKNCVAVTPGNRIAYNITR